MGQNKLPRTRGMPPSRVNGTLFWQRSAPVFTLSPGRSKPGQATSSTASGDSAALFNSHDNDDDYVVPRQEEPKGAAHEKKRKKRTIALSGSQQEEGGEMEDNKTTCYSWHLGQAASILAKR
ncbi:hypothetical protein Bbelb_009190 [Branchiostoma belcheri]|nr:hypothetical protein Bbelb_009190 [Branchiostoma belcheri]